MNQRSLLILVAALALVALASWLMAPDGGGRLGEGDRVLPGLRKVLNEVEAVTVRRAGDEVIAILRRTDSGWVVENRDGYRANFARLRQNLVGLAEARIFEAKTANPEFYERLGVRDISDEHATGTELEIEAGDYRARVIIGSTSEGSGKQAYLRRADEAQSYLVNASLDPGANTTDWLDTDILNIPSSRVRSVQIEQPDGEILAIARPRSDSTNYTVADIPPGRSLTYDGAANSIGAALAGLQLEDVQPASDFDPGTAAPVVATFETFDGLNVVVRSWVLSDRTVHAFSASVSPSAATAAAEGAPESATAEAAAEETAIEEQAPEEPADAAATPSDSDALAARQEEAEAIDTQLAGWIYTLPSYKAEQFTRRMDDLLAATE